MPHENITQHNDRLPRGSLQTGGELPREDDAKNRLAMVVLAEKFATQDSLQKGIDLLTETEDHQDRTLNEIDNILIQTMIKEADKIDGYPFSTVGDSEIAPFYDAAKSAYDLIIEKTDENSLQLVMPPNLDEQSMQYNREMLSSYSPYFVQLLEVLEKPELIESTDELIALAIRSSITAGKVFQHSQSKLEMAQQLIRARVAAARVELLARQETSREPSSTDPLGELAGSYSGTTAWESYGKREDVKQRLLSRSEALRDMLYEFGGYGYSIDEDFSVPNLKDEKDITRWMAECNVEAVLTYKDPRELAAVKQIIRNRAEQAREHFLRRVEEDDHPDLLDEVEKQPDGQAIDAVEPTSFEDDRHTISSEHYSSTEQLAPEDERMAELFFTMLRSGALTHILKKIGGTPAQLDVLQQMEKRYKSYQEQYKKS